MNTTETSHDEKEKIPVEEETTFNEKQPEDSSTEQPQAEIVTDVAPKASQAEDEVAIEKAVENESHNSAETPNTELSHIIDQFGERQGEVRESGTSADGSSKVVAFDFPPRISSLHTTRQDTTAGAESASDSKPAAEPLHPPKPDPESDLPFDFHRFLEQLRHRTADPVAKFLRSFLIEFSKKQWQVHEQIKIITDFLTFIAGKMAQCEVWRTVSDAEFDNAREGMEKLVMNRLYSQTFSPEIPPPDPARIKGRRPLSTTSSVPGRKGQHQEDVERDEVLAQKIRIYGWIREEHLDIPDFGQKGRKYLTMAQQELVKIKAYRAPRDKVICILNSCKVLFGFLRSNAKEQNADAFIPLLIHTVLKAKPDNLVSNVQYILRFRNQDRLNGEAGYYMSSLMGAIQFIENLDRTSLTISDEDFDKQVEAAVSTIAEPHHEPLPPLSETPSGTPTRPRLAGSATESVLPNSTRPLPPHKDTTPISAGPSHAMQDAALPVRHRSYHDSPRPRQAVMPVSRSEQGQAPLPDRSGQPTSEPLNSTDGAAPPIAGHAIVVETLTGMFPDLDPEVITDVVRWKKGQIGPSVDACLGLSK